MSLERLFDFVSLLNNFREVERTIRVRGLDENENDVEHSYQLAMVSWYLLSNKDLGLDAECAVKYALAHDLVEVYAGDTYFYTEDEEEMNSKEEREKEAALRLKKEFPEFNELHRAINGYMSLADDESRFVYALDKILPIINIYLDGGRTWRQDGVTLEKLLRKKTDKVAVSEEVYSYFEEIVSLLKEQEIKLFGSSSLN